MRGTRASFAVLMGGMLLGGVTAPSEAQESIVAKFTARSHSFGGQTLPFRLFVPEAYDSTLRYPLVLTLHGSGERGTDNITHIRLYRIATAWADPVNQARHPCLVASPQCPPGFRWEDFLGVLNDMMDSLGREFSVDTNRLYVTGLSMGGYGTWSLIAQRPDRFAAAVPMSAGLDPAVAPVIRDVPVWNFHGAIDGVVPVAQSRGIMDALEREGVRVVYTHCQYGNCAGLPDSVLDRYLDHHAQALYTEYESGGHVIWNQSYDHPKLFGWVFEKYRQVPGTVVFTSPGGGVLSGAVSVSWTGGSPADSVELWYSDDGGGTWTPLARSLPNTGSYLWDTSLYPDGALGRLEIFLRNSDGFIYSSARSEFLRLDNPGNGTPTVTLQDRPFRRGTVFRGDSLTVEFRAADPEMSALNVTLEYSPDDGLTYETVESFAVSSDTLPRSRTVLLPALPNSLSARLRVRASDGALEGSARTSRFAKETFRFAGPAPERIAGGGGNVQVRVVDPAQLTGHRYRVTFDDTSGGSTVYDVTDVTQGMLLIDDVPVGYGSSEGPVFDGLRLIVQDFPQAVLDPSGTRWVVAAPTIIPASAYIPTLPVGADLVTGKPYPADYRFTFSSSVVDTSSDAIPGYPAKPVTFSVRNLTENRDAEFVFSDWDGGGTLTNLDAVFILEPSLGDTALSWGVTFAGALDRTLPLPGDVFELRTFKPLSGSDVLEFDGVLVSVAEEGLPAGFSLWHNYPNPFNPVTTIRYSIPEAVPVRMVVYDLLGREVAVLVDGVRQAGTYEVMWDARGRASGMYVCRVTAGGYSGVQKLMLVR